MEVEDKDSVVHEKKTANKKSTQEKEEQIMVKIKN